MTRLLAVSEVALVVSPKSLLVVIPGILDHRIHRVLPVVYHKLATLR